jgi:hypothetical protein
VKLKKNQNKIYINKKFKNQIYYNQQIILKACAILWKKRQIYASKSFLKNLEGYNSTGQALCLLPRGHQFESHKPQSH